MEDTENCDDLFIAYDREISGSELKNLIENKTYYTIFADLQAYPKGEISNIKTYEDFFYSKCEIVLIIVDNIYTAIYCKNKEILNLLYQNAHNAGFTDISYITDENDFRTHITAW